MAEEPQSICEWLDIELDKLSADDKIRLLPIFRDTAMTCQNQSRLIAQSDPNLELIG